MAIIQCPSCGARISSAAAACENCKQVFDDNLDTESIERKARNKRFIKRARLQNYSFLSVVIFAAGALLMYYGMSKADSLYQDIGGYLVAGGFVAYIVLRGILLWQRWT